MQEPGEGRIAEGEGQGQQHHERSRHGGAEGEQQYKDRRCTPADAAQDDLDPLLATQT